MVIETIIYLVWALFGLSGRSFHRKRTPAQTPTQTPELIRPPRPFPPSPFRLQWFRPRGLRAGNPSDTTLRCTDHRLRTGVKAGTLPAMTRMIFLTLLLIHGAPAPAAATNPPAEIPIGEMLPDAALQGLNGPSRKLSDYRGKPLIINVWASWCGPCRAEMASLERLAWRNDRGDFRVIGISTDDYPERATALLDSSNATISHFIDYRLHLETLLGASRLPLTVLVAADGRVVEKVYGARAWDSPDAIRMIAEAFDTPQGPFLGLSLDISPFATRTRIVRYPGRSAANQAPPQSGGARRNRLIFLRHCIPSIARTVAAGPYSILFHPLS